MKKVLLLLTVLMTFASCAHKHFKVSKVDDTFKYSPVESRTRDLASSEFTYRSGQSHYHFESQKERDEFVTDFEKKYDVKTYKSQGYNDRY